MHLMIETAVILAIFSNIDHAFGAAIERGVKDSALGFGSAFYCDAAKGVIPSCLCSFFDRLNSPGRNLSA